jgi:hypothetical protein
LLAEPAADAVGVAGFAAGLGAAGADRVGGAEFGSGVVATEFVAGVPAGDAGPPLSELAGPAVRVDVDAGDEVGAGPEDGAGVEEATVLDAGVGSAWRRKFQKARANVTSSNAKASLPHGIGVED